MHALYVILNNISLTTFFSAPVGAVTMIDAVRRARTAVICPRGSGIGGGHCIFFGRGGEIIEGGFGFDDELMAMVIPMVVVTSVPSMMVST